VARASRIVSEPRRRWFRRARNGIEGRVRIDARTKDLLRRLEPGEIAVVLHEDIDQLAAEGLIDRRAAAVINCHRSMTGRYPNGGPLALAHAGVPLIDDVGEDILAHLSEGDTVRIEAGDIYLGDTRVASGELLAGEALARSLAEAEVGMADELDRFVRNTIAFLQDERDLVLRGEGLPALRTVLDGRDAVVVVRGGGFRHDLRAIRGYISDVQPVLIAVDGAADAMIEDGLRPDIIIGDMDSVSIQALRSGAEVVVHAYPDGHAPGWDHVQEAGVDAHVLRSGGTSEDIALLLAFEKGADLIVAVGAHDNLVEFLDKRRSGMASTFVVRLKVGPKLVDAKGVNRLYRQRVRTRDMVVLVASALVAMLVAGGTSPSLRLLVRNALDGFADLFRGIF
jgi:uncharacterized membrane-anchored protein